MNTRISTELQYFAFDCIDKLYLIGETVEDGKYRLQANEFAYYHMSLLWYLSEISDKAGKEALERVRIGYPRDGQNSKKALMRTWATEYVIAGRQDEALYEVLGLLLSVSTSVRLQNLRKHVWNVAKTGYPVTDWGIWETEITWDASEFQVLT